MLDQNTDRTWWMIGAVVVGAAMVALAKVVFPGVLTNVEDFFVNMIPKGL
ncbi:MAG: hypothetical protein LBN08_03900 [Lactobacillales bacterium]|jgi:hypothetical protein|nr:hypothetical protein [Lactobacillales bacterium]